jgi:hypothetical protein
MTLPLTRAHNLKDTKTGVFNATAGNSAGSKAVVIAPCRGQILEVGFIPASLVASAITLSVLIGDQTSTLGSNFTEIVTSTLGSFSSAVTYEGSPCSVVPATAAFVNAGDAIKFVTSGGNAAAIGAEVYAIIRRG